MSSHEEKKKKLRTNWRRRVENPDFAKIVDRAKAMVIGGTPFSDIRRTLNIKKERDWRDLISIVGESFLHPEMVFLEWNVRQQGRYALAAESYQMAKKEGDYNAMMRAVLVMAKLDENDIELKKSLGILKPQLDPETGGTGYRSEDLSDAENKYKELLDERILKKLQLQRETQGPIPVALLDGPQPQRSTDRMGEAPLVEIDSGRHVTDSTDQKSLSDGTIDSIDPVDSVAMPIAKGE
jgi:hypothetical protein